MIFKSNKLLQILKLKLQDIQIDQNLISDTNELELCDNLLNAIQNFDGEHGVKFNFIDELIEENFLDESEQKDPVYEDESSRDFGDQNEYLSMDYMMRVFEYTQDHPNHTIKTISNRFRKVTSDRQKNRIIQYVLESGNRNQKLLQITNYTFEQFKLSREMKSPVHDSDLRRWALSKSNELKLDNFVASHSWLNKFKNKFRISSRKVSKFVSVKSSRNSEEIENESVELILKFNDIYKENFEPTEILNTDQSGFRYHHLGNRTLSFKGEKMTSIVVPSLNPTTHSYTIQPVIDMAGNLLSPLFIVLKESGNKFGPIVSANLPSFSNINVKCSKSGKLDSNLFREWVDECLDKMVEEKCLLFLDGWRGQTKNDQFELDEKQILVEYFPDGSTSFMQPCDIVLFHPWKDMVKRFTNHILLKQSDIDVCQRNNILKLHSLIHNQFCSSSFKPMWRYGWYKCGFLNDHVRYENLKEICFDFNKSICDTNGCSKLPFIECAYSFCKKVMCIDCFFKSYHFH